MTLELRLDHGTERAVLLGVQWPADEQKRAKARSYVEYLFESAEDLGCILHPDPDVDLCTPRGHRLVYVQCAAALSRNGPICTGFAKVLVRLGLASVETAFDYRCRAHLLKNDDSVWRLCDDED